MTWNIWPFSIRWYVDRKLVRRPRQWIRWANKSRKWHQDASIKNIEEYDLNILCANFGFFLPDVQIYYHTVFHYIF